MNAIDLFSGIGGFSLGLTGYTRTVLYCEADAPAQSVLLSRMAEGKIDCAPICTDIREITAGFIDVPIDIICGGFPCQDISVSGKGVGLEGKRSGLFFEIVRLAKEIKPTFLFLENVSAIRTRGLDRVIEELTEVGYDLRWCMLSASDVGAKHKRERWFLLAARRDALANPEGIGSGRELRDISGEKAEIGQPKEQHEDEAGEPKPAGSDSPVLADTESIGVQGLRTSGQPQPDPHGQSGYLCARVKNTETSGQLNPLWVDWLMGLPLMWSKACPTILQAITGRKNRKVSQGSPRKKNSELSVSSD